MQPLIDAPLLFYNKVQRWSRGPNVRGQSQGPTFRGQALWRPRTEMVEAKDQGHNFSKFGWANFSKILNAKVFKIFFFVKFLKIIRKE